MDQPRAGLGIAGHEVEIIAVSACRFGFFLSVQALRQSSARFRPVWLNFQRVPESGFRFFGVAFTKRAPPEVIDSRNVVRIQIQQRPEGFRGAGSITRTALLHCRPITATPFPPYPSHPSS